MVKCVVISSAKPWLSFAPTAAAAKFYFTLKK
jgi:hypothetical protein